MLRQGKVQLIDATSWYRPLRKNLGKKNCEFAPEDINRVVQEFLTFKNSAHSRVFENAEFGYRKVTVERPLRVTGIDPLTAYNARDIKAFKNDGRVSPDGSPVIKRIHKGGKVQGDPLKGLFPLKIDGKSVVVEYEPDSDLRDTETVPFLEDGGVEAFIRREVLPHAPDAWVDDTKTQIGYEISFTRYFYKPQPLRSLADIRADIIALENETDGLMSQIIGGGR